ncbi:MULTISPECIES: molybdenum ABC transporter ATP-binding protein [unclassified Halorhodospira]|uniref:molybdenum ABC transporter ATP-binding protein n=1 Tax=unclassified Halorhodospira TaxID=2626748 RepID=UPI001EE7C323|nr:MULTISPECIES: molybdenum ABC transporter ATP-binding protein [unclassified Halorhodospira]MCG5540126.1 molybdenum ABC transporter ATP-binding protein [Halorhodospira sp. M39old]MCG5544934.1 molybdenum ABC transporter ATP-binding protein [Halorhodospira sp. M38]
MGIQASFRVDRGDFRLEADLVLPGTGVTTLFGRSGSGKTTLLRCLAGLERVRRGRLVVNGSVWQDEHSFLPVHRRPLGYVFQEPSLFPHLNVRGNLLYGRRRTPAGGRRDDLDEITELLGLAGLLERPPGSLSGGQRQRVAIGRALLAAPRLLLMDEPLASLDTATRAEILPYFERLHRHLRIPIVYVTHALDEAARLADHMVLLESGEVRAEGPLQTLLTQTDLPLAQSEHASAVLELPVARHHPADHLTELDAGDAPLYLPRLDAAIGEPVRVRVHARDVSIARTPPTGVSLLNRLPARITAIADDPSPSHALVRLEVAGQPLLARITRRSSAELGLAPGVPIHAMVKGVALR